MSKENFNTTLVVDQTPNEVFEAIKDVRGWWTGKIDGSAARLGDEFTYRYQDMHWSKQRVTELVPGKKIVWLVLDGALNFVKDKSEWNGTKITFEIAKKKAGTEVRFTHVGLAPDHECFDACSDAWSSLIKEDLRNLIEGDSK